MPRGAVFLVALAALTMPPARAQRTDELASVKQEQARLRESLENIDRRIRALEGASSSSPAGRPAALDLQRKWSEVQPGIAKAHVDELLGTPERVMRINGDLVWYYIYPGIGRGSVFFNNEDKVTATQPPTPGWAR